MKYRLIIKENNCHKEYFYYDIRDALADALSYQEDDYYAQLYEFAHITLEELNSDGYWSNWTDEEGNTLEDYTLINGKPMCMV